MALEIELIPIFNDNYVPLITAGDTVTVVDPGDGKAVEKTLQNKRLELTDILITHHHDDHIGGLAYLKKQYGCTVTGPAHETKRIAGMDALVKEGDTVQLGDRSAHVLETPGHTTGHIVYHFGDDNILFCGDTLFSIGCGRLFEGTPAQMWDSLQKIRILPDETSVYCAHEYTQSNIRFALSIDPQNVALNSYAQTVTQLRQDNIPTVPCNLGLEKQANPFLRADQPDLQAALGMENVDPVEVFAEIRTRKDVF